MLSTEQNFTNYNLLVSIYDSAVANKYNLNATSLNVLNALARYYNPATNEVFPLISTIANKINAGVRTVNNSLNELVKVGLIVKKRRKYSNRYFFTDLFFTEITEQANKAKSKTCQNSRLNRQKRQVRSAEIADTCKNIISEQNNITTSSCEILPEETDKKNDDEISKEKCKKIISTLNNWNYSGGQLLIKQHGVEKLDKLMEFVESQTPLNKGAYLRTLIKSGIDPANLKAKSDKYAKKDTGIIYKSTEQTRAEIEASRTVDNKSPFNDRDTAIKYLSILAEEPYNKHVSEVMERVRKIWILA
jgi:predicted transcriptional regulator